MSLRIPTPTVSVLNLSSNQIKDNVNDAVAFPNSTFLNLTSQGIKSSIGNVILTSEDSLNLTYQGIRAASSSNVQLYPSDGMNGFTVSGDVSGYATVPSAPQHLTVESGDSMVLLSWNAPADDGGASLSGYVVRVYSGGQERRSIDYPVQESATIGGLTNGTSYTFRVFAKNIVGESTTYAEASATPSLPATVPDAPFNLTVADNNMSASLTWQAPANDGGSDLTGYVVRVYYNTDLTNAIDTLNVSGTSATVENLTNFESYKIRVFAKNIIGESTSYVQGTANPTLFKSVSADFTYSNLNVEHSMADLYGAAVEGMTLIWTVELHSPAEVNTDVLVSFSVNTNSNEASPDPANGDVIKVDGEYFTNTLGFTIPAGESSFFFEMMPTTGITNNKSLLELNQDDATNNAFYSYWLDLQMGDQTDSTAFKVIHPIMQARGWSVRVTRTAAYDASPPITKIALTTSGANATYKDSQGISLALISSQMSTSSSAPVFVNSLVDYANINFGQQSKTIDLFGIPGKQYYVTILLANNGAGSNMTFNPLYNAPSGEDAEIRLLDADGNEVPRVRTVGVGAKGIEWVGTTGFYNTLGEYVGGSAWRAVNMLYPMPPA